MRGDVQQIERESFWREHQDTLVRIREELSSGKKSRSKFSPFGGIKKKSPTVIKNVSRQSNHPPYGKYRRTPSPYLPKLNSPHDQLNGDLRSNKFEVVPPVKPKVAFTSNNKGDDYDSWGEDSDNDNNDREGSRSNHRKNKPQPYPSRMQGYMPPSVVYGAPFPLYYPPPPQGTGKNKSKKKPDRNTKGYRDIYNNRRSMPGSAGGGGGRGTKSKGRSSKNAPTHRSMPAMYPTPFMIPMMYPTVPEVEEEEDEDGSSDEEMGFITEALQYFDTNPIFSTDFITWFLYDILDTDILPDMLISFLHEIKHMPYDHPMYIPTLYACEDFMGDQISEMVSDVVREVASEVAEDLIDAKALKTDPLEQFLTDLIDDAVRQGTREVVRTAVSDLAQDYLETECAMGIINNLVDDYVDEMAPELFEDVLFEIYAEEFIEKEVLIPETHDEAMAIARETIQHFDNKVMRKELKTVTSQAQVKLADSILMDYMLHLMTQQGKLWGEEDHYNKFLDDFLLNTSMSQMFHIEKQRDKTLHSKPLHKLHQKVVSDVALDVFLQQLSRSLDEDMADVDEYERGVNDGVR